MVVVGKYVIILADNGNKVDVSPFTPDYQATKKVLVLDVEFQYKCQYTEKVYILMFRNNLSVPSMDHNLISLFIKRKSGLVVKDTAKIHDMDPSMEDHSIYFPKFDIRIALFLHGLF